MQPNSSTIIKVISNQASAEEKKTVEKWAEESPENINTLKSHKKLWSILDYECDHCPDLQKAWNKINSSITSAPTKTRSFDLVYYAQRVAAVLFLFGMLAFTYFAVSNYQSNEAVNWTAITANGNPQKPIVLPDNSKVWLKKGSTLKFANDFAKNRDVQLSGGAFFEVTPNGKLPFEVKTNQIQVVVTGTKFLISENDEQSGVFVKEGSVSVTPNKADNQIVSLSSGQGLRIDLSISKIERVDFFDQNSLSWFTGNLTFSAAPLSEVISQLESIYDVKFTSKSTDLLNCRVSATFDQKTLPEIIGILDNILNVTFKNIDSSTISISGKGC